MGRAIIQHPTTKKYRIFSSVVDQFITEWMTEEEYYKWAIEDFIDRLEPPKVSTWYSYSDAIAIDRHQRQLNGEDVEDIYDK